MWEIISNTGFQVRFGTAAVCVKWIGALTGFAWDLKFPVVSGMLVEGCGGFVVGFVLFLCFVLLFSEKQGPCEAFFL